jgi:uncharacterized protein
MSSTPSSSSSARRFFRFPVTRVILGFALLIGLHAPLNLAHALLPWWLGACISVAISVGVYAFIGISLEGRTLGELGIAPGRLGRELPPGFVAGAALFASVIVLLAVTKCYRVTGVEGGFAVGARGALTNAPPAFIEEILFRGLLFRAIEESFGSIAALVVSAAFFGAAHLANPHASLVAGAAIALEAGVLLGVLYMATRSIWAVVGLHWAWNWSEGTIFGTSVSGHDVARGVFASATDGPAWWTGGDFGPEAGTAAILMCSALAAGLVVLAIRRARFLGYAAQRAARRARIAALA